MGVLQREYSMPSCYSQEIKCSCIPASTHAHTSITG